MGVPHQHLSTGATMRGGDVPDFLNFARKEVVSETTQLKVCNRFVVGVGGEDM